MKILFATSSLPRNFQPAFVSATKYVFRRLESKPFIAGYFANASEGLQSEIRRSYDAVAADQRLIFQKDPELDPKLLRMDANIGPGAMTSGMHGILYQWLSMKGCLGLILDLEKEGHRFDWVILARPDLFYLAPLERLSRLLPDALYFPTHDNWGGLNDRFCMGATGLVKQRMAIFDYFVDKWYAQFHSRLSWNPEIVLHDFIRSELQLKVRRTRIAFGKLRADHVTRPQWDLGRTPNRHNINMWLHAPLKAILKLSVMGSRTYPKESLRSVPLEQIQKSFL